MSKAERIVARAESNPFLSIKDLATEFNTCPAQVRRVLRRYGLYEERKVQKKPLVEVLVPKYKDVVCVEGFLTDIHIPFHDEDALGVALGYLRDLKPDRINLGEILDFHQVSVHAKTPEGRNFDEEIALGRSFLWQVRSDHPHAQIDLEGGNHNGDRWAKWLAASVLRDVDNLDIEELLCLADFGVNYVSAYDELATTGRPTRYGELFHLHGHEANVAWRSVNVARNMWIKLRYNCIFGHFHKSQEYVNTDIKGRQTGAWSVGCLCDLHPRFMPVNDWNHGFAVIHYHDDGTFQVENHKIVDGMVV